MRFVKSRAHTGALQGRGDRRPVAVEHELPETVTFAVAGIRCRRAGAGASRIRHGARWSRCPAPVAAASIRAWTVCNRRAIHEPARSYFSCHAPRSMSGRYGDPPVTGDPISGMHRTEDAAVRGS